MTMGPVVLVVPGSLHTRTGGYLYDQRVVEGLRRLGWRVDVLELDSSFPCPTRAALEHAGRALAAVPAGTIVIVDSLALGAMPELVIREASRLAIVALVHLPLAAATGLDCASAAGFERAERRALGAAALVVVTGRAALPLIARYDVAPTRIVVIEPGTDRVDPSADHARADPGGPEGSVPVKAEACALHADSASLAPVERTLQRARRDVGDARPVELLTVATFNPGKGHEALLEALASLPGAAWRLTCAGSLTRDPATAARVRATATRLGLDDRVRFAGELDRDALAAAYAHADVFVLATGQETYGMAVAEALAHGLPVVATATGAIEKLVGDEAGIVVPVGNGRALTRALARMIGDADLRARLADGARRRAGLLPTWDDASRRMAAALYPLCSANARG